MPDDDQNNPPSAGDEPTVEPTPGAGVTPGGYSYQVVNDDAPQAPPPARESKPKSPARRIGVRPVVLAAAIIVPAVIVGALVYFVASMGGDSGGDDERLEQNVANVVNLFTQTDGTVNAVRYEGQLPPSFPEDIPTYPGSRVISSIVQIRGADAGYIVVFDTADSRDEVSAYFAEAFNEDPWQVEIEQAGRESTVLQFSNVEDADVAGVVLAAESMGEGVTTIFMSINVIGGAEDNDAGEFDPGVSRPLPDGFPEGSVPLYEGGTVIETGFQQSPQGRTYLITFVTEDSVADVLNFYRDLFVENGWTVEDAPPGSSQLPDGEALSFTSEDGATAGSVEAGAFDEADGFTQVSIQVSGGE